MRYKAENDADAAARRIAIELSVQCIGFRVHKMRGWVMPSDSNCF